MNMRLPRRFRPMLPTYELVERTSTFRMFGGEVRQCVIVRDTYGVLRRAYVRVPVV